jgi:hypothetical protein
LGFSYLGLSCGTICSTNAFFTSTESSIPLNGYHNGKEFAS